MECWLFLHLSCNHPALGVDVSTLSTFTTRPKTMFHQFRQRFNGMMGIPHFMISINLAYVIMHSSCLRCRRVYAVHLTQGPKNTVPLIQTRSKNTVPLNQTKNLWNDGYFTFYQFNLVSVDSVDTSTPNLRWSSMPLVALATRIKGQCLYMRYSF